MVYKNISALGNDGVQLLNSSLGSISEMYALCEPFLMSAVRFRIFCQISP